MKTPKKEFTIFIGARQPGKTTLLQQVFNNLKKTEQESMVYYIRERRYIEEHK